MQDSYSNILPPASIPAYCPKCCYIRSAVLGGFTFQVLGGIVGFGYSFKSSRGPLFRGLDRFLTTASMSVAASVGGGVAFLSYVYLSHQNTMLNGSVGMTKPAPNDAIAGAAGGAAGSLAGFALGIYLQDSVGTNSTDWKSWAKRTVRFTAGSAAICGALASISLTKLYFEVLSSRKNGWICIPPNIGLAEAPPQSPQAAS